MEALMFSVYFAAVNSLTNEQCTTLLGEEKVVLMVRYRDNVEKALAKADFLNSTEMPALQALVIFLVCWPIS